MNEATIILDKRDPRRQLGTLHTVSFGVDRIYFKAVRAQGQAFARYFLDGKKGDVIRAELYALFGAHNLRQLDGRRCWALRAFPYWNEPIEGLETLDGARFTLSSFRKRHMPEETADLLRLRTREVQTEIAYLAECSTRERVKLAKLPEDYIDWSLAVHR